MFFPRSSLLPEAFFSRSPALVIVIGFLSFHHCILFFRFFDYRYLSLFLGKNLFFLGDFFSYEGLFGSRGKFEFIRRDLLEVLQYLLSLFPRSFLAEEVSLGFFCFVFFFFCGFFFFFFFFCVFFWVFFFGVVFFFFFFFFGFLFFCSFFFFFFFVLFRYKFF